MTSKPNNIKNDSQLRGCQYLPFKIYSVNLVDLLITVSSYYNASQNLMFDRKLENNLRFFPSKLSIMKETHAFSNQKTVEEIFEAKEFNRALRLHKMKCRSLHNPQHKTQKIMEQKNVYNSFKIRLNNQTIYVTQSQNEKENTQISQVQVYKTGKKKKVPRINETVQLCAQNCNSKNILGEQNQQLKKNKERISPTFLREGRIIQLSSIRKKDGMLKRLLSVNNEISSKLFSLPKLQIQNQDEISKKTFYQILLIVKSRKIEMKPKKRMLQFGSKIIKNTQILRIEKN